MGLFKASPADYQKQLARETAVKSKTGLVITGIDIPFSELVRFLVKLSIAIIPASIILTFIGMFLWSMLISAIATK